MVVAAVTVIVMPIVRVMVVPVVVVPVMISGSDLDHHLSIR
jgi:hypothetical protein